MQYRVKKNKDKIDVEIDLPSSKSISNRLLIMSALSGNLLTVNNLSDSDDTVIMKRILSSGKTVCDVGHAGTAMRFLTAYFAIGNREVILTGTERMKNRPIGELVNKLKELGADIQYLEKEGFPPLRIKGKTLEGGHLSIDSGVSSQFISAILMISPYIKRGIELELTGTTISSSYIWMTAELMRKAGVRIKRDNNTIAVKEGTYGTGDFFVEPDWSSASYWFEICGLEVEAKVFLPKLSHESLQGDAALTEIFKEIGVKSHFEAEGLLLQNDPAQKDEFHFDFSNNPDLVQSCVPYCVARGIPFRFSGCKTLLIKETDRLWALSTELRKFGVDINYAPDGNIIYWDGSTKPYWNIHPVINTYHDHRMALSMVPLVIKSKEILIENPGVVTKSYPDYWNDLRKAGFRVEEDRRNNSLS